MLFVSVAQPWPDYTARRSPPQAKSRRTTDTLTIALRPTVDILATVAARPNAPYCVGFGRGERRHPPQRRRKAAAQEVPLIVANHAAECIRQRRQRRSCCSTMPARTPLPRMGKLPLARRLSAEIAKRLPPPARVACRLMAQRHAYRGQGARRADPCPSAALRDARLGWEWTCALASTRRSRSRPDKPS
jgi:hypothetical protein